MVILPQFCEHTKERSVCLKSCGRVNIILTCILGRGSKHNLAIPLAALECDGTVAIPDQMKQTCWCGLSGKANAQT